MYTTRLVRPQGLPAGPQLINDRIGTTLAGQQATCKWDTAGVCYLDVSVRATPADASWDTLMSHELSVDCTLRACARSEPSHAGARDITR